VLGQVFQALASNLVKKSLRHKKGQPECAQYIISAEALFLKAAENFIFDGRHLEKILS